MSLSAVMLSIAIVALVSVISITFSEPMFRWESIFCFVYLGLYFYIIFGTCADANKRGKPGCLVTFLVASMPIMGLIMWLIFRPY